MPKIIILSSILLVLMSKIACAQNCTFAGAQAWAKEMKYVIADCDNNIPSPDGKLILNIDKSGQAHVYKRKQGTQLKGHVSAEPPYMVSWSPTSNAFFIDDQEGSGETSVLRVYALKEGKVIENNVFHRRAVSLYRGRIKCDKSAADPNTSGFGWSSDGKFLYVLIQATVHDPCGDPYSVMGAEMDVGSASIVRVLSKKEMKVEFSSLLPKELFYE